ncbi:unnamed protein product [Tuber melanosporum]|uniref:(Perigord truffle) hypothetical protein n=1 Tax=Tuber melanosporum (strain Mel28) TaxID=656061 RepID=D5G4W4_TUBMM|nr:unnamed protein product [Tuber melanosporum]
MELYDEKGRVPRGEHQWSRRGTEKRE